MGTGGPRAGATGVRPRRRRHLQRTIRSSRWSDRLDLEKYKATIKGLTQFGDRRQGTDRNRDAIDWIEAQLKSYGCTNTERIKYHYQPPPPRRGGHRRGGTGAGQGAAGARGAGRGEGAAAAGGGQRGGGRGRGGQGGSTILGNRGRTGVNNDPNAQAGSQASRAQLAAERHPARAKRSSARKSARPGPTRCTSSARHMDGHGWGEAANDDGSGTALVMELARIFNSPDVQTERSIRFALWNNEETGLNGARAYVDQRKDLQGKEDPPGSRKLPRAEMARDDPARHDDVRSRHAGPDGKVEPRAAPGSRRQHRVPVDGEDGRGGAEARLDRQGREREVRDRLSAAVGPHMTNTDSTPFMDLVPAISLRENERGRRSAAAGIRTGTR